MRPSAPPLHFGLGLGSALAGHALAGHEATTTLAHAPHQVLLAAPLALGALLATREDAVAYKWGLLLAGGGLAAGNALLALL